MDDGRLREMVEEAMEHAVEEGSRRVLTDTLTAMGFDVSTPEKLIQVQVDMAYLRRQRQASEQVGKSIKNAALVVVVTGALGMLWMGLQAALIKAGGG